MEIFFQHDSMLLRSRAGAWERVEIRGFGLIRYQHGSPTVFIF
jgi:hypothetical protein